MPIQRKSPTTSASGEAGLRDQLAALAPRNSTPSGSKARLAIGISLGNRNLISGIIAIRRLEKSHAVNGQLAIQRPPNVAETLDDARGPKRDLLRHA